MTVGSKMHKGRRGPRAGSAASMLVGALLLASMATLAQDAAPTSPAPLDVDADGHVAAETDGLLVLRHLFGFTGANLVNGALGADATRDAAAITAHLGNLQTALDADGDASADALTDGLLILRRLLGQEGAALTDAVLSPGATRDAAAIAAHIDSLGTAPPDYGQAPVRMQLVQANSLTADSIQLDWLPTFDNDTPGSRIRYRLHASEEQGFVPDAASARAEVIDNATGTITGLTAATTYYVKVEAVDAYGNNSWSNELEVVTADADPVPTSAPRQVLDDANAPNQNVQPDQLQYDLGPGAAPPQVGEYLVSTEGNGFLRRATGVQRNGDQVTVTTEPAALNELYENLDFSASIKLVDLPDSAAPQARAVGRGVVFQRSGDTVRATWPESGLSIVERRPPSATPRAAQPRAAGGVCNGRDGEGGERWDDHDFERVLKVSYVKRICIEPGHTLSIDVAAEIEPEEWENWEITQLFFLSMRHPGSYLSGFGEQWNPPNAGSDVIGWGTLTWTPKKSHVDDDLRPYTARFVAIAKEREGHCTGFLGRCNTKRVYVETDIVVSWGEFPTQREFSFKREGSLDLYFDTNIDFQPEIVTDARFHDSGRLYFGRAALKGPISVTAQARVHADGAVSLEGVEPLLDKRFTKVFTAGPVPIVVSGELKLNVEFRGSASGSVDLTQTLEVGYDLLAGLQYSNGNWDTLTQATPWQRYDLRGEAEARGFVELRLVPDLTIAFYEVVTGQLIVEPYLYGEAEVEGYFSYGAANSSAGFTDDDDADYRFTKLEFGGGVDGEFRAALEVFDYTIAEYPWSGAFIEKTPFLGLPALAPFVAGRKEGDCNKLEVNAEVTDVPNPFKGAIGGPDSLNTFVQESGTWEVVLSDGVEYVEPADEAYAAWFVPAGEGGYTLRFAGHSEIGSFVRQYEELDVDFAEMEMPGEFELTGMQSSEGPSRYPWTSINRILVRPVGEEYEIDVRGGFNINGMIRSASRLPNGSLAYAVDLAGTTECGAGGLSYQSGYVEIDEETGEFGTSHMFAASHLWLHAQALALAVSDDGQAVLAANCPWHDLDSSLYWDFSSRRQFNRCSSFVVRLGGSRCEENSGFLNVGSYSIVSLAYSPDGRLFGSSWGQLVEIDTLSLEPRAVGANISSPRIYGIEFLESGELIAISRIHGGGTAFYVVDPDTAEACKLGETGSGWNIKQITRSRK